MRFELLELLQAMRVHELVVHVDRQSLDEEEATSELQPDFQGLSSCERHSQMLNTRSSQSPHLLRIFYSNVHFLTFLPSLI